MNLNDDLLSILEEYITEWEQIQIASKNIESGKDAAFLGHQQFELGQKASAFVEHSGLADKFDIGNPDFVSNWGGTLNRMKGQLVAESIKSKGKSKKSNDGVKMNSDITNSIFVVHGHDELSKNQVSNFLRKVGLEPIILHEQPNNGQTIIEKFEKNASKVCFAIVLLTPDDIGSSKLESSSYNPRARQNVVLELGYFMGLLGRNKVAALYKDSIEIPSDYMGVVYTKLDDEGVWQLKLAKELKHAGVKALYEKLI